MRKFIPALVGGTFIATAVAIAATGFTFDGAPSAPLSYQSGSFLTGWDVQVHDRGMSEVENSLMPMAAQHGVDCAPPPATHPISGDRASTVFQCKDHFMTSIHSESYGVIYLTPPAMVDFTTQGKVTFELSTEDTAVRDWWDLTVSPFNDSQALPLLSALSQGVDLQNPNRNAVVVTTDNGEGSPRTLVVRNGVDTALTASGDLPSTGVLTGTNQAATRQTFMLTLTPTHVKFERLASATAPALIYTDATIASLGWTQGVVQFGHHSYVPTKDGIGVPQTWHWDNVVIDPSAPLTIQPVAPKYTNITTNITHAAAPSGAYLRFSAICKPVIDGVVSTKMTDSGHPEHFANYLVPVAAGSTTHTLSFVGDDWYTGLPCAFKDASLVSTSGAVPPPTPTPTPTPPTYRCQIRNPNGTYTTVWTKVGGGTCP